MAEQIETRKWYGWNSYPRSARVCWAISAIDIALIFVCASNTDWHNSSWLMAVMAAFSLGYNQAMINRG